MPDILNGDARESDTIGDPSFDRAKWVAAHGPESWMSVLDRVIAALKAVGVERIGTTGYCFGAPPALYLALKNESHVTVLAHPSRLAIPDDLQVCGSKCWRIRSADVTGDCAEIQGSIKGTSSHEQL